MTRKPDSKMRLDEALVNRGLAENLDEARGLIMAGRIMVGGQRTDKAGAKIAPESAIAVKETRRFVSRGGDKLAGALSDLGLTEAMRDSVVLDVGASTGGFTQCALAHGAKLVIALDVGTGQLDWQLRNDARVISLENTDIRDFPSEDHPAIDWVLADISFNSLARLAPALRRVAARSGVRLLVLVKPQFELAANEVPPGGLVTDDSLRATAVERVKVAFTEAGLRTLTTIDSRLAGRAGNREIFLLAENSGT